MQEQGALELDVEVQGHLDRAGAVDDAFNGPVEELACRRHSTVYRDALRDHIVPNPGVHSLLVGGGEAIGRVREGWEVSATRMDA